MIMAPTDDPDELREITSMYSSERRIALSMPMARFTSPSAPKIGPIASRSDGSLAS